MRELGSLAGCADDYDKVVAQTPGIDGFCSLSCWVMSAHENLHEQRELMLFAGDGSYVLNARSEMGDGRRVVEPLECMWGLAASVVGIDPVRAGADFVTLLEERSGDWDLWVVSGLLETGALLSTIAPRLVDRYEVRMGPMAARYVADLSSGVDGFLRRRSRNFRRSFIRASERADDAGLEFELAPTGTALEVESSFQRLLAVEAQSWKGRLGAGIDSPIMAGFYRSVIARLVGSDAVRLVFATVDGTDMGYVLGATVAQRYRGLQFSYVQESRDLSIGNLLQLHEMRALAEQGVLEYDLGSEIPRRPYKVRWADRVERSPILLVMNS
jgi:hypothetical protein